MPDSNCFSKSRPANLAKQYPNTIPASIVEKWKYQNGILVGGPRMHSERRLGNQCCHQSGILVHTSRQLVAPTSQPAADRENSNHFS